MLDIILASGSPRRSELLKQIGIKFSVKTSDADESYPEGASPENIVAELSSRKAYAVFEEILPYSNTAIIAADTIVVHNGDILGKPKSREDAFNMLNSLSDEVHQVYTGVTIVYYIDNKISFENFYECTNVYFNRLSEEEINKYIDTWEPMDKAGAYGIQGKGAVLVKKIEGDYYSVVGLPVAKVYNSIKKYL